MIALLVLLQLLQPSNCRGEGAAQLEAATARARQFDLDRAADMFAAAAGMGCPDAAVAAEYLRGLSAARAAYGAGGSPESLAPVRRAIAALDLLEGTRPGRAQIARFVLLAAAAASQSERDEMALMLDQALRLEDLQLAAGQPGAPAVSAHEAAGDLWLQVHRFEDARAAYRRAEERTGRTPRVTLGLARAAARLQDGASACRAFADLVEWWGGREGEPPEIREAREFLRRSSCSSAR